jgi:hypothetical protein
MPSNDMEIATMTVSTLHTDKYRKVCGAINRSFINAHFSINAHFLTTQTYKRMRLLTGVYGMSVLGSSASTTVELFGVHFAYLSRELRHGTLRDSTSKLAALARGESR